MYDDSLFSELPRRPAWSAFAAPVGGWAAGTITAVFAGRFLESLIGPAPVLAALVLAVVSLVAIGAIHWVATRSGGSEPWQLGLDRLDPVAVVTWSAVVALPGVAVAWLALTGSRLDEVLDVPASLAGAGEPSAFGVPRDAAPFDLTVVAAALAACVLPAVATELALRGVALPALAPSIGRTGAGLVTALLTPAPFALLTDSHQGGPVLGAALVLGLGISFAYMRTADLYPGVAALSLSLGVTLGMGLAWSPLGVVLMGLACAVLAVATTRWLVALWPVAHHDRNWRVSRALRAGT